MGLKFSTGALDDSVTRSDQMNPAINYRRPRRGGDAIFDLIGDFQGKSILDMGCGLARFRKNVEAIGAKWVGLELAGDACSVVGNADQLPFPDESFDGVLCSAILEHMPDPHHTVGEAARVLKPGGIFFGYVSFLEPFHGISYYHLSHKGLEQLLSSHGLRPLRIYPSKNGAALQIETMLFPRYVPIIQPMVRRVLQGSLRVVLAANRLSRRALHRVQRRRDEVGNGSASYDEFVELQFAVGFNFIAERQNESAQDHGYARLAR